MIEALRQLGFEISTDEEGAIEIKGRVLRKYSNKTALIDVGNGTAARFIAALLALQNEGDYTVWIAILKCETVQ